MKFSTLDNLDRIHPANKSIKTYTFNRDNKKNQVLEIELYLNKSTYI